MTRKIVLTGIAGLLLLASCNNQPAEEDNTAPQENYQARMAALTPGQREMVMLRAIRDGGRDCPDIDNSAALEPINHAPAWQVTCNNRMKWIVVIGESGFAVVTSESELRANGIVPKLAQ